MDIMARAPGGLVAETPAAPDGQLIAQGQSEGSVGWPPRERGRSSWGGGEERHQLGAGRGLGIIATKVFFDRWGN